MKYLLLLLLAGCASMNDYDRGCKDGLRTAMIAQNRLQDQNYWDSVCDNLAEKQRQEREDARWLNRR